MRIVDGEVVSYYSYSPSRVAAIIFLVSFLALSIWHGWIIVRKRVWFFIPLLIGSIMEVFGFLGRYLGHSNDDSLGLYILQTLMLLIAPTLFAASVYMILGRLVMLLEAEHLCPIRATWMTKIFLVGDIVSFFIQGGGGGLMSQEGKATLGKNIVLVGLFIQIIFFGLFIIVTGIVHHRLKKNPTRVSAHLETQPGPGWLTVIMTLYAANGLIFVRSIFRVIEFAGGQDGKLMTQEVWIYVFDSLLMLFVVLLLAIWHPSRVVPSKRVIMERRKQESMAQFSSPGSNENLQYGNGKPNRNQQYTV